MFEQRYDELYSGTMKFYLALILLLPLSGCVFNALFGRGLSRRVVETVGCSVVWGAFICSALAYLNFTAPAKVEYTPWLSLLPIAIYLDKLSLLLTLMTTFVCGLLQLYSAGSIKDNASSVRYFSLLNIFVFAMLTLILAESLPLLYLGWEGVGFCSYLLVDFWHREKKKTTARRKAFIVTCIGDTALGIALAWMFQLFSTASITELNGMGFLMPGGIITALGILLLLGAVGKLAQLPLSFRLTGSTTVPAPASASARIHAATMAIAGVYLLIRMLPLIGTSPITLGAIAIFGW